MGSLTSDKWPLPTDDYDRKLLANVKKHGWHAGQRVDQGEGRGPG